MIELSVSSLTGRVACRKKLKTERFFFFGNNIESIYIVKVTENEVTVKNVSHFILKDGYFTGVYL